MDKAAASISDGDLVDALIHGYETFPFLEVDYDEWSVHRPEQHWGLMPLHAVCSTVRPASFLYGVAAGYGGPNAMTFPAYVLASFHLLFILTHLVSWRWLGQNSKQGKLNRQLGDVQIRMRLKVSGDRSEIRQSYLPALFPHIVAPLMDVGAVRGFFSMISLHRSWWIIRRTECCGRGNRTHGRVFPLKRRLGHCCRARSRSA